MPGTAADLIIPDAIEIINPECHIATLEKSTSHLTMEFIVQKGRGYVPANIRAKQSRGAIPIDAIYTPLRKASYVIEHTRVGKMVNFDRVLLEVSTDGTCTPDEALRQSGKILMQQFLTIAHP